MFNGIFHIRKPENEPVLGYTPKSKEEKENQRKFFFWYKKEYRDSIIRDLKSKGRNDLIDALFGENNEVNTSVSNVAVVPSRGNSTKKSITRLRPGSLKPGGFGVDIKHGSYDRYLARLKGKKPLKTQNPTTLTSEITNTNGQDIAIQNNVIGNKTRYFGIVGSSKKVGSGLCFC